MLLPASLLGLSPVSRFEGRSANDEGYGLAFSPEVCAFGMDANGIQVSRRETWFMDRWIRRHPMCARMGYCG